MKCPFCASTNPDHTSNCPEYLVEGQKKTRAIEHWQRGWLDGYLGKNPADRLPADEVNPYYMLGFGKGLGIHEERREGDECTRD
ncbi:MAG: hypothetical protein WC516_07665 [Patescibacteria group bacterium]